MKIKLLAVTAVAVLALSMLTACGEKNDDTSASSAAESSTAVEESSEESSEAVSEESTEESGTATSGDVYSDFAVSYNGAEVKLGDNINDKLDSLGDQAKPSEKIQSCVAASDAMAYYYDGLEIDVREDGTIYAFNISGGSAKTVSGIGVGSAASDIDSAYSSYTWDVSETCYFYTDKTFTAQFDCDSTGVTALWIYSSELAM